MKRKYFSGIAAFLVGFVPIVFPAFAQTPPVIDKDSFQELIAPVLRNPFPMSSLAECKEQGTAYHSAGIEVTVKGANLILKGRDHSNHKWQVQEPITGLGCTIFQADLDGNGTQDLVIHSLGITTNNPYDTLLTLLLFDEEGRPVPWSTTGRYDRTSNGIRQITQPANGQALILHSYTIGLPMWGGVTYVADLYSASSATVSHLDGLISGMTFPVLMGPQSARPNALSTVRSLDLATSASALNSAPAQKAHPLFVGYGAQARVQSSPLETPLTSGQAANIRIDTDAVEAAQKHILLSDNTTIDIPQILVVDSINGERKIVVHPDEEEISQLQSQTFQVKTTGRDCEDSDDCRPFTLQAVELKK